MAAPDKVLMLIRSLSAAEKRYFHRHTQHHGRREPHYWQLYRFIEQWPGDDWPLATELPDFPFRDHVAVVKNQLYERLLDALHLYYLENQPEEQLKRWLHQAHLLLRRGQPDGARKRSQQARQWIEDQAAWTYWPELMELDRQIMEFTFREKDQGAALQAWQEDYRYGLEQLLSALPYAGLKARIAHQHLRRVSLPENELAAFRHEWSELPITEQPGAAADYYQAQALLAFMERQPMEARAANERLLSVLADQDPARHGVAERYLATMYNLLIDQLQLGAFDALNSGIARLRALPRQPAFRRLPRIEARIFQWSYQLELNSVVKRQAYAQARDQLPLVATGLQEHEQDLAASAVASLRHLAGLIAFHNDQPQVALDFLTPLYQTSRPQIAHEIFHYAQFLHLLAHSEAGHTALVDHLSLNLRRQLGKDLAPAEGQLLRLIRQLLQAPDRQSVRELWAAWAAQLPAANDRLSLYLDLPFLAVRKGSS